MVAKLTTLLDKSLLVAWTVILFCVATSILWAVDRAPPFAVQSFTTTDARAGETVEMTMLVRRDVRRDCNVTYTRIMFDSGGVMYPMTPTLSLSADAMRVLEMLSPGVLRLSFVVPQHAAAGRSELVTSLSYVCNPLHVLWPIQVVTRIPFEVSGK